MSIADAGARAQALDLSCHIIAVAPAGSGKTGLLVQRCLAALTTVEQPEQVVAITFTNKAAAEIRHRLALLLQRAESGTAPLDDHDAHGLRLAQAVLAQDRRRGWNLLANPERLRALTIDGFNAQIAAELPLLSGLGGRPRVSEDPRSLYQQALLALFDDALSEQAATSLGQAAAAWLRCAGNRLDRLLPPLAELLARRDQWAEAIVATTDEDDDARDQHILDALHCKQQQRFTQALGEDCEKLIDILREASTLSPQLDWAATLTSWPDPGAEQAELYRQIAIVLVTKTGELRKAGGINARQGFPAKKTPTLAIKTLLAEREGDDALAAIAHAVQQLPPAQVPLELAELRAQLRCLLRQAWAQLRLTMAARGEVDFTELALAALGALRPAGVDADAADEYGEALLKRDTQIRHLLVDEMQDTSSTQMRLIRLLVSGWQDGDGHSLFLVGDPQQSIYAFRKAEVRLFLDLWESCRLDPLTLTPVRLQTNFRSAPPLIDWFNHAFEHSFPAHDNPDSGEVGYAPVLAPSAAVGSEAAHNEIDDESGSALHACADEVSEAEAVAARAAECVASGGSVAILARARPHLRTALTALRERGLRYACQDIDALAALPAVRDVLACARALWHPQDRLHWAIWLRASWVGFSWADLLALSRGRQRQAWPQRLQEVEDSELSEDGRARRRRLLTALENVQSDLSRATLAERVEALWMDLGGQACVDASGLADARRALQLLRLHTGAGGFTDLPAFERAVAELYALPAEGAVQVMTIHKAKGLEFDHVLLVGCGRKSRSGDKPLLHLTETPHGALLIPKPPEHWPQQQIETSQALFDYAHRLHSTVRHNETLRLLYVAATRARRTLDIYIALKPANDGSYKPPSGSFAAWLWPLAQAAFDSLPQAVDTPTATPTLQPPRSARLPLDFVMPEDSGLYVPREIRTLRPSERVLSAREAKREDEDAENNVYAQQVGTMFHQAMARIADDGITHWLANADNRPYALAAGFRRMGLPDDRVDTAVNRVLALVGKTLDSDRGRWLLAPKRWAAAEYALSGYRSGAWVAAAIDRCFEEADGSLWIIDYKATAEPLPKPQHEDYVAACRQRYAPQLRLYAELMAKHRAARPIHTALYLPEIDRLEILQATN